MPKYLVFIALAYVVVWLVQYREASVVGVGTRFLRPDEG